MKIPFNQVKLENIDYKCFKQCDLDNELLLQAIIDKLCIDLDWSLVDLKCLSNTTKDNPIDILNLIIPKICTSTQISSLGYDLTKLELCGKDNWNLTYEECLNVLSTCFPTLTLEAVLQAIIKRINSYSFHIAQLNLKYNDLSQKYTQLQTTVNQLTIQLNNCC